MELGLSTSRIRLQLTCSVVDTTTDSMSNINTQRTRWYPSEIQQLVFTHSNQHCRGVFWKVKTQSAKIWINFNFWGGRGWVLESQTQSAKICLNFNFLGGRGWVLESQNPKCQDLPKFQFGEGCVLESQNPKCQDLPKFQFGEGCILEPNSRISEQFGPKFLEA